MTLSPSPPPLSFRPVYWVHKGRGEKTLSPRWERVAEGRVRGTAEQAPGGRMIIEQATIEDAPDILELQRLAYQSEAEIYGEWSIPPLTQTLDGMRDDIVRQLCLKALLDGKIVGSVRGVRNGDTCEIGRLIVCPDFQGRGIGTRLMEAIEGSFESIRRFELFTGHRSERNIRLYQKLGYAVSRMERISDNLQLVFMEKKA